MLPQRLGSLMRRDATLPGRRARWLHRLDSVAARRPLPESPWHLPIVYGPVRSRRFGRSLGVNLTPPGCPVCSLHCVYCELVKGRPEDRGARWPAPGEVGAALANALPRVGPIESVTISGNGEPTLHPRFGSVVADIIGTVRRARPQVPVRVLTNGTQALRPSVRRALDFLDERIVTMDAEPESVNQAGPNHPLDDRIAGACSLRDLTLQSCFIEGAVSNVREASVSPWIDVVREICPRAVQVYTIDRPAAAAGIRAVPREKLEGIAGALWARTGIEPRVFP